MKDQAHLNREVRVFLSSTFKDMQKERDYLIKNVFPEVRDFCEKKGVGFTEIDLRWGITEEEAKDGSTIAICLHEIDRCREFPPFFIGFLGERYGWIPDQRSLEEYFSGDYLARYKEVVKGALRDSLSVTQLEIDYALEAFENGRAAGLFYLRNSALTAQIYEDTKDSPVSDFYDSANGKLEALKDKIRNSGALELDGYSSIEEFGESIKNYFYQEINSRYPDIEDSALAVQRPHRNFAKSRLRHYEPIPGVRSEVLNYCRRKISGTETRPALVVGASGSGKSSFMADLVEYLPKQNGLENATIYGFHISSDGRRSSDEWLADMLLLLEGSKPKEGFINRVPTGNEKWDALVSALNSKSRFLEGSELIIILDGLDQFKDADLVSRRLQKLRLPDNVIVVASGCSDLNYVSNLFFEINLPDAGKEVVRGLLDRYASEFRKFIPQNLQDRILKTSESYSPLYIKLMLEQLRIWSAHETLAQDAAELLNNKSAEEMFISIINKWDAEFVTNDFTSMVSKTSAFLAASRAGLSEHQLRILLAQSVDNDLTGNESKINILPQRLLSQILSVLRPYLLRYEGRELLMHRALAKGLLSHVDELAIRRFLLLQRSYSLSEDSGQISAGTTERVYQAVKILDKSPSDEDASGYLVTALSNPRYIVECYKADRTTLIEGLEKLVEIQSEGVLSELAIAWECYNPSCDDWELKDWIECNRIAHDFIDLAYLKLCEPWSKFIDKFIRFKISGERFLLATNQVNLGAFYVQYSANKGDSLKALEVLNEALPILKEHWGGRSSEVAKVLHNIAGAKLNLGEIESAYTDAKKAYEISKFIYPEGSCDVVITLCNIGRICKSLGDLDKAEASLLDSYKIGLAVLDAYDVNIICVLITISELYLDKSDFYRARYFSKIAVESTEQSTNSGAIVRLLALKRLAKASKELKLYEEAIGYYQESLGLVISNRPQDVNLLLDIAYNLAETLLISERLDEAESVLVNSLEMDENELSKSVIFSKCLQLQQLVHQIRQSELMLPIEISARQTSAITDQDKRNLALDLNNRGVKWKDNGQFRLSEVCLTGALSVLQDTNHVELTEVAIVLNGLADLKEKQNDYVQSEKLFREVLKLRKRVLGAREEPIAHTHSRLGIVLMKNGDYPEAEAHLKSAIKIFNHVKYPNSKALGDCLSSLGRLFLMQESVQQAVDLFRSAIEVYHHCGSEGKSMISMLKDEIRDIESKPIKSTGTGTEKRILWWNPWSWRR